MEETVLIKKYNKEDILPVSEAEVWRYAGYRGIPEIGEENLRLELSEVIKKAEKELVYKIVYLKSKELPFETDSKDLKKCLEGSEDIYMFAATIGIGIDRLISINERISPTKALLLQALGAERVEALCDRFCEDIERSLDDDKTITMRFSPGYGDLPLSVQKDFFRILDCNRRIGISLNESLLMSPSKSVTAIFAIVSKNDYTERRNCLNKCDMCPKRDCEYRGNR